jgi:hypothetical protein
VAPLVHALCGLKHPSNLHVGFGAGEVVNIDSNRGACGVNLLDPKKQHCDERENSDGRKIVSLGGPLENAFLRQARDSGDGTA